MKARIEFYVEIPDVGATEEEAQDWLRFEFGDWGEIEGDNPLIGHHAEPYPGSFYCRIL